MLTLTQNALTQALNSRIHESQLWKKEHYNRILQKIHGSEIERQDFFIQICISMKFLKIPYMQGFHTSMHQDNINFIFHELFECSYILGADSTRVNPFGELCPSSDVTETLKDHFTVSSNYCFRKMGTWLNNSKSLCPVVHFFSMN